jgi:predicted dinucleotide-binding enzyme
MGAALATGLSRAGHDVLVGSRAPTEAARRLDRSCDSYAAAASFGPVAFLAVPWPHGLTLVRELPNAGSRVLVDVTNPESEDGRWLVLGHLTSGAEQIAAAAPGHRVVKAFNHVYAELLQGAGGFDGGAASVLYCGDDRDAKRQVRALIEGCGMDPVDAGPLAQARYLEPLAMLTVQLVREQGWGPTGIAWRVMRRRDGSG